MIGRFHDWVFGHVDRFVLWAWDAAGIKQVAMIRALWLVMLGTQNVRSLYVGHWGWVDAVLTLLALLMMAWIEVVFARQTPEMTSLTNLRWRVLGFPRFLLTFQWFWVVNGGVEAVERLLTEGLLPAQNAVHAKDYAAKP